MINYYQIQQYLQHNSHKIMATTSKVHILFYGTLLYTLSGLVPNPLEQFTDFDENLKLGCFDDGSLCLKKHEKICTHTLKHLIWIIFYTMSSILIQYGYNRHK